MKNLKPFLLGSIAGCGAMFMALQYHVVQSHDGLQLIPRTPQVSLGLAWADVREWDAETWTERPELARALVAHGSSDLISESVARAIANSSDPDSGTIGQLRDLLNGSMSSEFDAPLFDDDRRRQHGERRDDDLTIPFMQGNRDSDWGDLFTSDRDQSRNDIADRSQTGTGFSDLDDVISEEQERRAENHSSRQADRSSFDGFSQVDGSWGFEPQPSTDADTRRRDTTILEDLLFSDDEPTGASPAPMDSAMRSSRFDSFTRALDSRASQALDRAQSEFFGNTGTSWNNAHENAGNDNGFADWTIRRNEEKEVPHAVRALRDGFDPFNE